MIISKHKIIIVRHGETDNNLNRVIQDYHTPLNTNGELQAKLVVSRIKEIDNFTCIYSSELYRAKQTAKLIGNNLGVNLLLTSPLFNERDQGILKGLSHDVVKEKFPQYWDFVNNRINPEIKPENGESWMDLIERAKLAIDYINNNINQNTIIVSHGGFMRALITCVRGISSKDEIVKIPMSNCEIHHLN